MTVPAAWGEDVRCVVGNASYVNDVAWNVVAYNTEFVRMFPRASHVGPAIPDRNLMRYMLLDEEVSADPVAGPIYRAKHVAYVHPNGDTRRMRFPYSGPAPVHESAHLSRSRRRHIPRSAFH
ncbi:hypothetical protein [Streptomyces sp. PA5.6]|uniref:hypothetical protein n=1 Tax=Streptomyces sp. PA5.6 TaxID=3035651 RepID=UPI0039047130